MVVGLPASHAFAMYLNESFNDMSDTNLKKDTSLSCFEEFLEFVGKRTANDDVISFIVTITSQSRSCSDVTLCS